MRLKRVFITLVVLLFTTGQAALAADQGKSYGKIRKLLRKARDSQQSLGKVFAVGDDHIPELLQALDDSDSGISAEAQQVLRYLANPVGLQRLCEWSKVHPTTTGPIPIPVSDCDFEILQGHFRARGSLLWPPDSVYTLWLDGSERARRLLTDVEQKIGTPDKSTYFARALEQVRNWKPVLVRALSREQILGACFFVPHDDWGRTEVSVLGINKNHDKALVLLYVNRGVLAEQWWHVVLKKSEQEHWRFMSIRLSITS